MGHILNRQSVKQKGQIMVWWEQNETQYFTSELFGRVGQVPCVCVHNTPVVNCGGKEWVQCECNGDEQITLVCWGRERRCIVKKRETKCLPIDQEDRQLLYNYLIMTEKHADCKECLRWENAGSRMKFPYLPLDALVFFLTSFFFIFSCVVYGANPIPIRKIMMEKRRMQP